MTGHKLPCRMPGKAEERYAFRAFFYIVPRQNTAAKTGLHHGNHREIIPGFKQDIGRKAAVCKNLVHHRPHCRIFIHQNKWLILQVTDI